ncbi:MAG: oxidoreductase [Ferrimicrobium sp.]
MRVLLLKTERDPTVRVPRLLFGPIRTNLAKDRRPSRALTYFYRERCRPQVGVLVTEVASVVRDDWPYEYAPLAEWMGPLWHDLAAVAGSTAIVAGLGHAGAEGSSAYSLAALVAPSDLPSPSVGEVPVACDDVEIEILIEAFVTAAVGAVRAGCSGVEINAGGHSLIRQFLSPLTNLRGDIWGVDRARFLFEVLARCRRRLPGSMIGVRLSIDEGIDWGGLHPKDSSLLLRRIAPLVDYVVPVQVGWYRPECEHPDFLVESAAPRLLASSIGTGIAIVAGGGVTTSEEVSSLISAGATLVEATRALVADPSFDAGTSVQCLRCNQRCMVGEPHNYPIDCVVRPRELLLEENQRESVWRGLVTRRKVDVLDVDAPIWIIGAGVAGVSVASGLVRSGIPVRLRTLEGKVGGWIAELSAQPEFAFLKPLHDLMLRVTADPGISVVEEEPPRDAIIIGATGSLELRPVLGGRRITALGMVLAHPERLAGRDVVVIDPLGDYEAVGVARLCHRLGARVAIATSAPVVGSRLPTNGAIATAHRLLAQIGISRVTDAEVRGGSRTTLRMGRPFGAYEWEIPAEVILMTGARRANSYNRAHFSIGDALVPRSIIDARRDAEGVLRWLLEAR